MLLPLSPPLLSPGTLQLCHSLAQCSLHCQRNQSLAPAERGIGRERGGKKGKENIKKEGGGGWRKGETVVLTKVKGGIEFVRSIARGSVWRSEIVQMC